nr:hypothetical protein [uncultured Allomuricauda sp.]
MESLQLIIHEHVTQHLKTTFRLTYRPFWNFLKWYGLFLASIFILGPFLYEWRYGNNIGELFIFYRNTIGFITLVFIPYLILLITYFQENKKTEFSTDIKNNIIEINQKERIKTYRFSEIKTSIYHRNTYTNDLMWQAFSYADLGYWDLTFKNGDRYFLTSYLIDTNKKPLLENTEVKYSLFPSINKTDPEIVFQKAKEQRGKRIEKLKRNFMHKSESELKEITISKDKYQEEAIQAAKLLLKNKNVV